MMTGLALAVARRCWQQEPRQRPSFPEIVDELARIADSDGTTEVVRTRNGLSDIDESAAIGGLE